MQIVHTATEPRQFHLKGSFLSPYYAKGDPFESLLARSTYVTKYARDGEMWTDTIRRVVEGNVALSHVPVSEHEAELLFHLFWTGQALPPGRGLWTGGVPGIPADARFNCWYTTLYGVEDWCWMMDRLMLGGGVGIGLGEIHKLDGVSSTPARFAVNCVEGHSDFAEVRPNDKTWLNGQTPVYRAEDSRAGWVESLRRVLTSAWTGRDYIVDVSDVRPRGRPIKTFGGIACGPGPLTHLLRSVWDIVRGAAGRRLTSVECLDITNMIGFCVKSGNVRRSALIALGDAEDQPFRDAKKDLAKVMSHRHTSNNSLIFRSWEQIKNFNWRALVHDNIDFGEPGIFNLPLVWETDPGAKGVNPCLTSDSRVATQFGLVCIGDLARMGQALKVTTDARVQEEYKVEIESPRASIDHQNQMVIREAVPAFKTSDAEEVYRVVTSHGYTTKVTKQHKFPTPDGFVKLQHLTVGDTLLLQSGEGQWGNEGDEELGHIIGWVEGDGNFSADSKATLRFWGEQKAQAEAFLSSCQKLAATIPAENGREYGLSIVQVPSRDSCEISSGRLYKALAEVGYREKGIVPEIIWRGTRNCVRGYIRGLFATDGQVQWSKGKQSFSIRLSQSNPGLLREVQTLLLNFGIVSSVYKRRDAGMRRMPDGKGGMKDYWCEDQFDLVVAKQNAVHFAAKIGFLLPTHAGLYNEWKAAWVRGPYAETYMDEIRSIEFVGIEPVFCTTQPSHHTFIADGIVTGNCGEQALHDREACNLGENFPANFEDGMDGDMTFRLQVRYCMRQRLTPLTDAQSHEVGIKNMRIGVALGGLCDFDWTPKMLAGWYRACREEANNYADELGVNRPVTVTTVKPSGTISLLNGSSPGIHAPFAAHYIRRVRIAENDPMAPAMMEAGVPYEYDQYDQTGHTLVFSFPTKARHTRLTVKTETIRDQFERQAVVQKYWADNAVSSTLSFDPDTEREETIQLLEEFVPHFKSTSMLAKRHGYVQAPYEEINEATYRELHPRIQHDHPLVRGGEFEVDECSTGVCPVR
jgi:ribonucleotide reductase alpha subunit